MRRTFYLLLVLVIVFAVRDWAGREIVHPPGVLVNEAPRQADPKDPSPFLHQGFRLFPRASFELRARVLSREDYRWDAGAKLSPMDLALGWGAMSDQAVLDQIEVSQGSRWYYTRYETPGPLSDRVIARHSGNMHIVPANSLVLDQLRDVRRGDVIWARGSLVDAENDSGFHWRTSLSREDTGGGACELFYVDRIIIETVK